MEVLQGNLKRTHKESVLGKLCLDNALKRIDLRSYYLFGNAKMLDWTRKYKYIENKIGMTPKNEIGYAE